MSHTFSAQHIQVASSHRITESQNHRIVGVGRDLCGSSSPTLMLKQGHPEQGAQDLVQAGLEYLQRRRRLHNLPGQPVPVLRHPQREEVLPHVLLELPVPQFVPIAPQFAPVTGYTEIWRTTPSTPAWEQCSVSTCGKLGRCSRERRGGMLGSTGARLFCASVRAQTPWTTGTGHPWIPGVGSTAKGSEESGLQWKEHELEASLDTIWE